MQNGWILLVGTSDTTNGIYYQVTKGFQRDQFNARVFGRLLKDNLIHQDNKYPFNWILTNEAKEIKFKHIK